ncbi:TetR/AcrR family transcriptional regulator [Aldersonia kunmingensis]|uniref:TetR/AcrR family transcriptional regulator n=1 Tax=Aldersonia kunmingensis TaxID=408066 RepID=UPI00082EDF87|nr:TetR/AcrR family transcriptional regulator [Aldersonia kunmingensis]
MRGAAPPQVTRRRNAKVDGDARATILDAAERLFASSGFDATSTAAIARAAGVPKGLVFYYFPAKESILTVLLAERVPRYGVENIELLVSPGDPAASLINLDTAINLRDHRSAVLRVILWREAATHPDVRNQLRQMRTQLFEATVRVLQASAPAPVQPATLRACAATWVSAMLSVASTDRLRAMDGLTRTANDELDRVARVVAAGMVQLG